MDYKNYNPRAAALAQARTLLTDAVKAAVADGTLPEAGSDSDWWNMVYRWTDCPVLTGMELGSYTSDAVQSASGDSQQLLADYYIGIRGAWLKESASLLENSEPLWANLTAGAVSTAGEGH